MGSGSGPTSVWPSLYTAQPIYSLSIPGPLSPIASIFFLLMVVISHTKHHPQKATISTPSAANPLAWHSYECCPNPLSFQHVTVSPFFLFRVPGHPFKLPSSSYSFLPTKDRAGCAFCCIVTLAKNQCKNQTERTKNL